MEAFQLLNEPIGTLDLPPEAGCEVESVGVVCDGELASVASGPSEQTDLILCIGRDTVSEARQRSIAENLQLFKGHFFEYVISYYANLLQT